MVFRYLFSAFAGRGIFRSGSVFLLLRQFVVHVCGTMRPVHAGMVRFGPEAVGQRIAQQRQYRLACGKSVYPEQVIGNNAGHGRGRFLTGRKCRQRDGV
jgi:hypothetical protein